MAGVVATVFAAGPDSATPPMYRLSGEGAEQFRFVAREDYLPVGALAKAGAAVPANLAELPFAKQIDSAARQAALDPALVHAVIYIESRYNPAARSPKGAVGLMQLMPETALRYGVDKAVHAPEANLRAGTRYLSDLINLFESRLDLALAAYNAGENAVIRHGMHVPPYRETRHYVPAVLAKYRELKVDSVPERARISYLPGTRLDPRMTNAASK